MSQSITLQIPDELANSARALAAAANRSLEETLLDWIRSAMKEPSLESLSDESLLVLCDLQLSATQQDELSELLSQQRENTLSQADQARLDALLAEYRRGLLLKARALKEAADRGLRTALEENGS